MRHMTRFIAGVALGFGGTAIVAGVLAAAAPAPQAVRYWRAENVAKSFEQGAVLYAGDTNYMIHTSRRTAPGKAEVHEEDTDLIYVIEGAATFVTGGTVSNPQTTAPGEIRGDAIVNGETRMLGKGDVIIVPNGTPHWFREVRGPLHYYTIKVR